MKRPFTVCHMLTSLDGKIDGAWMRAEGTAGSLKTFGEARGFYKCKATLYGTTTALGSYSDGRVENLTQAVQNYPYDDYIADTDVENYIVNLDPKGILKYSDKYLARKGRPKAHVIEVLTKAVSPDYIAYLRRLDISYIFAGDEVFDCALMLDKLYNLFGIDRLMISGGGYTNWSFVKDRLVDEISLVIAPVADGNTTSLSIFEKSDFMGDIPPVNFGLIDVQKTEGGGLWLRYNVK